jgi:hypothetical protein
MAVADVVEAMVSHRPYRASLGIDAALDEISKNREILYDETAVDACLGVYEGRTSKYKWVEGERQESRVQGLRGKNVNRESSYEQRSTISEVRYSIFEVRNSVSDIRIYLRKRSECDPVRSNTTCLSSIL